MAEWFAPSRYGYGAGTPIAWQGWAVLGVFVGAITAAGLMLMPEHWLWFIWTVLVASAAVLVVTARTTRGGWRWRWGDED